LTQQERCNELLIADSVLLWHPQNTHLLNSALRVYQRLSDHKIMVDSTELEMTSNLLNKKRTSIDANELPPREQCPACKDHILFVVSHAFCIAMNIILLLRWETLILNFSLFLLISFHSEAVAVCPNGHIWGTYDL
jgi:hypothetical protein